MLALAAPLASALPPDKDVDHYILEHWGSSDGLPQNSVNGVIQDTTGYLWLATFDGLVRFDGARFVRMPDAGLPGRRLRIVGQDETGFWIGGEHGGLSFHDGRLPRPLDLERFGIGGSVSQVLRHGEDLWIATHNGLYRLRDDALAERFGVDSGLPDGGVWNLAITNDDALFVGTPHGLFMRAFGNSDFERVTHERLRDDIVYGLLVDEGRLWIGSEQGLFVRGPAGDIIQVPVSDCPRGDISVRSLSFDRHGNLWAGVWGDGLVRINADGIQKLTRGDGIRSERFTSIYEDREGSLWFGTDGGGLGRLRNGTVTAYGGRDWGLAGSAVTSITQDPDGSLWLGLNCEGVMRFDDGPAAVYGLDSGLRNDCIFTLLVDDSGRLWAGSFGSGVYRMLGKTFVPILTPPGHERMLALYQRADGQVLAGSDSGLLRHDATADRLVPVAALAGRNVRFITEGRDGRLWLATRQGVLYGDLDSGFEAIEHADLVDVRAIHIQDDGTVWLGTYGKGLFRFQGNDVFRFTSGHGLHDQVVSRIFEDEYGHFWLTGNDGIHGIVVEQANALADGQRGSLDVLSLGLADGMHTAETNGGSQPAGTMADDGRIWVPTIDGIATFDPARAQRNELPPPVVIERVVVDGQDRAVTDPLTLPAGTRSLEIHYTGLSLLVPDRLSFRYRLDADEPWQEAGNRRVAYFSSLPPGRHDFQVIAANDDGIWNESGAHLSLVAEAALYQRAWFPVLLALAGLLLISMMFAFWMRHARLRELKLTELVRQRTQQLQKANERLEQLARIDGLTRIPNRRHLEETLAREWGRACRRQETLALLMIDIDDFKAYNDHYGHQAGDRCLQQVAAALSNCLRRSNDFLGRYGGEELLAILPDTDIAGAHTLAERMRCAVEALDIAHTESSTAGCITISVGLAAIRPAENGPDPAEFLQRADEALYRAKRQGRNRIETA